MYNFSEIIDFNITKLVEKISIQSLISSYERLSKEYRFGQFQKNLSYNDAVAYACARMPATYGVTMHVLDKFFEKIDKTELENILDIGSGTGSLILATIANDLFSKNIKYFAIEKSQYMRKVAEQIIGKNNLHINFYEQSVELFLKDNNEPFGSTFLIYSLNEILEKKKILKKVFNVTKNFIFIIEPGTPEGFKNILLAKNSAKDMGYEILLPCGNKDCPLQGNDWCHFSLKIPRTKNHILLKNARLPYEDEKFCYIIISKQQKSISYTNRIIKRPIKKKGHTIYDICSPNGLRRISLSNKLSDKKSWGDEISILKIKE